MTKKRVLSLSSPQRLPMGNNGMILQVEGCAGNDGKGQRHKIWYPTRYRFSLSPGPELPAYCQSSTKEASAEERGTDYRSPMVHSMFLSL